MYNTYNNTVQVCTCMYAQRSYSRCCSGYIPAPAEGQKTLVLSRSNHAPLFSYLSSHERAALEGSSGHKSHESLVG
jgi:hypothetical protein